MQIKDVMTMDVTFVAPSTPIAEVARRMRDADIGATPVIDNDELVGMVTDRDIVLRLVAKGVNIETAIACDAMSRGILYCFADDSVERVLDDMGGHQVRRLPVLDRAKRLVGFVSLGDLSLTGRQKAAGEALLEISQPAQ
jgi:CBS domain-containing protein